VVKGVSSGRPWQDKIFDLRVEDSKEPLVELRRLVNFQRASNLATEGDRYIERKDAAAALKAYDAAEALVPDFGEMAFWKGVALVSLGRVDESLPAFAKSYRLDPQLRKLPPRLAKVGLLPDDPKVMARIVAAR
jgi:tetratricopeptide (TPR) repeat protein